VLFIPNVNNKRASFRGQARIPKMMSPRAKLITLACHLTIDI
jgi:hypothetical protein